MNETSASTASEREACPHGIDSPEQSTAATLQNAVRRLWASATGRDPSVVAPTVFEEREQCMREQDPKERKEIADNAVHNNRATYFDPVACEVERLGLKPISQFVPPAPGTPVPPGEPRSCEEALEAYPVNTTWSPTMSAEEVKTQRLEESEPKEDSCPHGIDSPEQSTAAVLENGVRRLWASATGRDPSVVAPTSFEEREQCVDERDKEEREQTGRDAVHGKRANYFDPVDCEIQRLGLIPGSHLAPALPGTPVRPGDPRSCEEALAVYPPNITLSPALRAEEVKARLSEIKGERTGIQRAIGETRTGTSGAGANKLNGTKPTERGHRTLTAPTPQAEPAPRERSSAMER
jgi:hypothetical protein